MSITTNLKRLIKSKPETTSLTLIEPKTKSDRNKKFLVIFENKHFVNIIIKDLLQTFVLKMEPLRPVY